MTDDRTGERVPDRIFDPAPDDEVADELRFHHDMYLRDLMARGHPAEAAARLADERLRQLDHVRDECRHLAQQREHTVRLNRYLVNLIQDVRFALRLLRQRPFFAAMAILPLALGIGAATTIYSVADKVLIRPLPFPHSDRLVAIWGTESRWRTNSAVAIPWQSVVIGQEDYTALRDRSHTLSQVAAWTKTTVTLDAGGALEPVSAVRVTASLFPMLGVRPALGRLFAPNESALNGPHIALLSWESWKSRFAGDSAVIGRSVVVGDTTRYTVVGVLPPDLRIDRTTVAPAVWLPAFIDSSEMASRHNRYYRGLGRLAPGVTLAQANAEVARIISDVKTAWHGSTGGTSGRAAIWQDDETAAARPSVLMLSGAVLLLLLIACVNVATLMLGEAVRRQPEIFARRALGATPGRLGRQLITESVAIAGTAAVLGALAARAGVRILVRAAPAGIPGITDARVDAQVLAFTIACALVIGVGFGLLPAFALVRRGAQGAVRIGTGQTQRGAAAIQRTLVAAEVALSIVMLVGCSLLGRSLVRLSTVNPGFMADGLFEVEDYSTSQFWRDDARVARYNAAAIDALRGIPGVTAVSGSSNGLFEGGSSSSAIRIEGVTYPDGVEPPSIQQRVVLPGYLRTIEAPLIAGRDFNAADRIGSEPAVILTQSAVKRDWGGRSPIGKHVIWQDTTWTVVGVARDLLYSKLSQDAQPLIYIPSAQWPGNTMVLTIRASADPRALESLVKARLAPLDPAVTVLHVNPVRTLIRRSYAEERYRTLLGSLFGVLAAVLAGVGVFGVISRTVAQRIREAGIRVALGAQERSVIALMLRDTLRGTAIGLAVGLLLAVGLARALTPYLFGVSASDPIAYLLALALLATTLVVATLPPARRAARVDPAKVLRTD